MVGLLNLESKVRSQRLSKVLKFSAGTETSTSVALVDGV